MSVSRWRLRAREVIDAVIASTDDRDRATLLPKIDAAYPFGQRSHTPYKQWLTERRAAIAMLWSEPLGGPMSRPCPACGAGVDRPCRVLEGAGDLRDVTGDPHEARLHPSSGPLFGEQT